jgi:hypothetical protein
MTVPGRFAAAPKGHRSWGRYFNPSEGVATNGVMAFFSVEWRSPGKNETWLTFVAHPMGEDAIAHRYHLAGWL